jgi:lipopolysaccharide/colanic/teichoic acid biosynthesis glycosyltransferase
MGSPGSPAIFIQQRTGKNGKRFPMYKFRTMVKDAEALKPQVAHLNELQAPDFKISDDPRTTKMCRTALPCDIIEARWDVHDCANSY